MLVKSKWKDAVLSNVVLVISFWFLNMSFLSTSCVKFDYKVKKGDEVFIPVFHSVFFPVENTYQIALITGFRFWGIGFNDVINHFDQNFGAIKAQCLLIHNGVVIQVSRPLSQIFPINLSIGTGR